MFVGPREEMLYDFISVFKACTYAIMTQLHPTTVKPASTRNQMQFSEIVRFNPFIIVRFTSFIIDLFCFGFITVSPTNECMREELQWKNIPFIVQINKVGIWSHMKNKQDYFICFNTKYSEFLPNSIPANTFYIENKSQSFNLLENI